MKPIMSVMLFLLLLTPFLFSTPLVASEEPSEPSDAFTQAFGHYEEIRTDLIIDQSEGVAAHGSAMHAIFSALAEDFSAEHAGVAEENAAGVKELLPQLIESSKAVADADSIEASREALYELSKTMVRYRKLVDGERPSVAYCSMHRKSWLQPAGEEIGNPYAGQSMPKCGEVVDP